MNKNDIIIRRASLKDIPVITQIYNEAIEKTVATFDTQCKTHTEMKQWFLAHGIINPILVAEHKDTLVGWAALSQWSDRCAYSDTAEISIYVFEKHQRKGYGTMLMDEILKAGKKAGLHTVIARITQNNIISIHMHEAFGFNHIGTMNEVGEKFGKRLDVYLMQKIF